jgi:hypothetical protein
MKKRNRKIEYLGTLGKKKKKEVSEALEDNNNNVIRFLLVRTGG